MRTRQVVIIAVAVLILAACGSQDAPSDAGEPPAPVETVPAPETPELPTDTGTEGDSDSAFAFTPSVAVPEGVPVYPGAELWSDMPSGPAWQWLYQTTGSGNEIVAFFTEALEGLGFEIDEEHTFAMFEEFFVATTDEVVRVYWLAPDEEGVDEDTPDRGYGLVVDIEAWEAR